MAEGGSRLRSVSITKPMLQSYYHPASLRTFVITFRRCGVGERRKAHAPECLKGSNPVCNVGSGVNRRDDLERRSNETSTRYPGIYSNLPIITCPVILYATDKEKMKSLPITIGVDRETYPGFRDVK